MGIDLRALLAERDLTVSEFARMTRIPQPTIHRIVNGQVDIRHITASHFMRIAHGLGLSGDELYFGDIGYDDSKRFVDRVYATTTVEGRQAMLANAMGVEQAFAHRDPHALPTIGDDLLALKSL